MHPTQKKNQYAIRAIFELAKHMGKGPRKSLDIAKAQDIPVKFLEVILSQLKDSGFLESKRGFYGGYSLVRSPDEITVGDVLRYMSGIDGAVPDLADEPKRGQPPEKDGTFISVWNRAKEAAFNIYDQTTIQDLLNEEEK